MVLTLSSKTMPTFYLSEKVPFYEYFSCIDIHVSREGYPYYMESIKKLVEDKTNFKFEKDICSEYVKWTSKGNSKKSK